MWPSSCNIKIKQTELFMGIISGVNFVKYKDGIKPASCNETWKYYILTSGSSHFDNCAIGFFGMTRKCTGAWGWMSRNAKHCVGGRFRKYLNGERAFIYS
uniref:Uncharacterized protein n=1 Tax=Ciona intestinalis TaxID=7719 RepID=H2XT54_CIOIN